MSEENTDNTGASELDVLRARCRMMGISYSNNAGVENLREKINEKMGSSTNENAEQTEQEPAPQDPNPLTQTTGTVEPAPADAPKKVKKLSLRQHMIKEHMALVRCRITNLDPKKANLPGEIITVANEYLGTVRMFVPFGEQTEDGWHIPKVIYEFLKARKFLNIRVVKDRNTQRERTETNWVSEFSLDILPPLTQEELRDLAQAQIAAGSVEA